MTTFGIEVPPVLAAKIAAEAARIDTALAALRKLRADWVRDGPDKAAGDRARWQAVRTDIDLLGRKLTALKPWGICPGCKLGPLRYECLMCLGLHYVTHEQAAMVPKELLRTDVLLAYDIDKKIVPLASVTRSKLSWGE